MAVSVREGGIWSSLLRFRTALTTAMIGAMAASAAGSRSRRRTRGKRAIMMLAGAPLPFGSRCQISSVMKGMKGWSRRSVVSRTSTRVACVRARAAGSSPR